MNPLFNDKELSRNTLPHTCKTLLSIVPLILLGGCAHQYGQTQSYAAEKVFPSPTDFVALDQIEIANNFEFININDSNIDQALKKCLPTLPSHSSAAQHAHEMLGKTNATSIFAHASSASRFVMRTNQAVCLPFSASHYPIFPAEMIEDTANAKGPAPEVIQDWDRQIAKAIAIRGEARVAYVFANGNAFTVRYYADQNDVVLHYPSALLKVGMWEKDSYDIKFTGDMTSFATVERNHESLKRVMGLQMPHS